MFSKEETAVIRRLSTPVKIQDFLNSIPFNFEKKGETLMSPRRVLREKQAHCLEGALLAYACLEFHKQNVFLLDLRSSKKDFDHVVAVFEKDGYLGAISKTNHAVLRYREPVYKTIRELALSYFHEYFLKDGTKTLQSYSSKPFYIRGNKNWEISEEDLWDIGAALDDAPHASIVPKKLTLRKADKIEIDAGEMVEWKK
jgi:hypothetical protein